MKVEPIAVFEESYGRRLALLALAGAGASLLALAAAGRPGWAAWGGVRGAGVVLHWLATGLLLGGAAGIATDDEGVRGWRARLAWGAALGAAGGLARALLAARHPPLGDLILGASLGLVFARGCERQSTRLWTMGATAAASLAAAWVAPRLAAAPWLRAYLPVPFAVACAGAAQGFLVALGSLPIHLRIRANGLEGHLREIARRSKGEPRAWIEKAAGLHAALRGHVAASGGSLPEDSRLALEEQVEAIALACGDLASRFAAMEDLLAGADPAAAAAKLDDLKARVASATDPLARAEYERAVEAHERAGATRGHVAAERDRTRARIEAALATLEGLRASLVAAAAATGGEEGAGAGRPAGASLDSLLAAARAYAEELTAVCSGSPASYPPSP